MTSHDPALNSVEQHIGHKDRKRKVETKLLVMATF